MTASEPRLPDDFSDVEEISRGSGRVRVALEILAAILVLVGIYYLFAPEESAELPPLPAQEIDPIIRAQIDAAQGTPQAGGQTAPLAAEPGEASQAPADTAAVDGETARQIIAAQRSGSDTRPLPELDRLALAYQQQGRATDAYLLWFYAARQGDGEAAFALGSLYDPNRFEPGSGPVIAADATQAYKWYSAAARQSVPQAAERLQALHAWLQSQADAGDPSARRQLLNWQ